MPPPDARAGINQEDGMLTGDGDVDHRTRESDRGERGIVSEAQCQRREDDAHHDPGTTARTTIFPPYRTCGQVAAICSASSRVDADTMKNPLGTASSTGPASSSPEIATPRAVIAWAHAAYSACRSGDGSVSPPYNSRTYRD